MENKIANYKNYTIYVEHGTKRGLFLRNPIQRVEFSTWSNGDFGAWEYMNKIRNPIRRIYEILIGNRVIVDNIERWSKDMDWGGFNANIICFPIYLKREYRRLKAICNDNTQNIKEIKSYGYSGEFIFCSGYCNMEKTKVKIKNGKTLRFKNKKQYHFTYEHIVERIIDSGVIIDE